MKSSVSENAAGESQNAGVVLEDWPVLLSTYGVICASNLLLAVAERSARYALAAAAFCGAHAFLVGPRGPAYVRKNTTTLLALGGLAWALAEANLRATHISYGFAHFLCIAQLIELYGPHTRRSLRLIQVAAVFEVLVAGVWALNVVYLPVFGLVMIALLCNWSTLEMLPDSDGTPTVEGAEPAERGAWADLWRALWLPAGLVFAGTLLLFVLLPRSAVYGASYRILPTQVTAFSDTVSLREVGQMRQSRQTVLRLELRRADKPDQPLQGPPCLLRGVSLPVYRDGQWFGYASVSLRSNGGWNGEGDSAGTEFESSDVYMLRDRKVARSLLLQKVWVESRPINDIFVLYRPIAVKGLFDYRRNIPYLSNDLVFPVGLNPGDHYEAISLVPHFTPEQLRAAGTPRRAPPWEFFWDIPDQIRPTLERTVRQIERAYQPQTDYDRVMAAQSYLLDSRRFTYTYELPDFGSAEPIQAFLTSTRTGSCEQFSTALALLVRVWGIPSRLVVGFKAEEFDPGTNSFIIRDSDAHAWVEVFFRGLGWVEFDPTPGSRTVSRARRGPIDWAIGLWRSLDSAVLRTYYRLNSLWGGGVLGYSRRQQRHLMAGMKEAARSVARSAGSAGRLALNWLSGAGPRRVGLGAVLALLLAVALGAGLRCVSPTLQWRLFRRRSLATVAFYDELLALLRRKGLTRPPHVTPREFARAAAPRLSARDRASVQPAEAVMLLTELYYRVRFGGEKIAPEQASVIRGALAAVARARPTVPLPAQPAARHGR